MEGVELPSKRQLISQLIGVRRREDEWRRKYEKQRDEIRRLREENRGLKEKLAESAGMRKRNDHAISQLAKWKPEILSDEEWHEILRMRGVCE